MKFFAPGIFFLYSLSVFSYSFTGSNFTLGDQMPEARGYHFSLSKRGYPFVFQAKLPGQTEWPRKLSELVSKQKTSKRRWDIFQVNWKNSGLLNDVSLEICSRSLQEFNKISEEPEDKGDLSDGLICYQYPLEMEKNELYLGFLSKDVPLVYVVRDEQFTQLNARDSRLVLESQASLLFSEQASSEHNDSSALFELTVRHISSAFPGSGSGGFDSGERSPETLQTASASSSTGGWHQPSLPQGFPLVFIEKVLVAAPGIVPVGVAPLTLHYLLEAEKQSPPVILHIYMSNGVVLSFQIGQASYSLIQAMGSPDRLWRKLIEGTLYAEDLLAMYLTQLNIMTGGTLSRNPDKLIKTMFSPSDVHDYTIVLPQGIEFSWFLPDSRQQYSGEVPGMIHCPKNDGSGSDKRQVSASGPSGGTPASQPARSLNSPGSSGSQSPQPPPPPPPPPPKRTPETGQVLTQTETFGQRCKRILRDNFQSVLINLNVSSLIPFLEEERVLNSGVTNALSSNSITPIEKARRLLNYVIYSSSERIVIGFVKALFRETEYSDHWEIKRLFLGSPVTSQPWNDAMTFPVMGDSPVNMQGFSTSQSSYWDSDSSADVFLNPVLVNQKTAHPVNMAGNRHFSDPLLCCPVLPPAPMLPVSHGKMREAVEQHTLNVHSTPATSSNPGSIKGAGTVSDSSEKDDVLDPFSLPDTHKDEPSGLIRFLKKIVGVRGSGTEWVDSAEGIFKITNREVFAKVWGRHRNNQNMTYDKLSRTMRYQYGKGLIRQKNNFHYQFANYHSP